jgi:hypothetical protein
MGFISCLTSPFQFGSGESGINFERLGILYKNDAPSGGAGAESATGQSGHN